MAKKTRHQPRLTTGPRTWGSDGLNPEVAALVARDAKKFGVSASWVKADIITLHYERVERRRFEHTPSLDRAVKLRLAKPA